ncbi:hypothetical protein BH10PSE3_BH10PSE3_08180 [soil metagenome]
MSGHFSKGDRVSWTWGAHTAHGEVAEHFERRVQRTIKGEKIVRNGSKAAPAYLVTQEDGGRALKSGSELRARGAR